MSARVDWRGAAPAAAGVALGGAAGAWGLRHRSSAAVRSWTPGAGRTVSAGPLSVRVLGDDGPVILLLHGLLGTGDMFGAAYDDLAGAARLVVPDLLGFGASMDLDRRDFSLEDHLDALDAALDALGLGGAPVTIVGHSLGTLIALAWGARHVSALRRAVLLCAPLYADRTEAREHIAAMGLMERLLAFESPLSERMCALMCRYRSAAQWLAVASAPEQPVPIARRGVQHTWPAYLGSMNGVLLHPGWKESLARLSRNAVPVVIAEGAHDPVPVPGRAADLARTFASVEHRVHPRASHDLPLAQGLWCRNLIASQ